MHPDIEYELVHENIGPLLKSKTREDAIDRLTYPATQEGNETGSIMSIRSGQKKPYTNFRNASKYIKKFISLFPEGHFIHIIRNPIDTISSQVRTFSRKPEKCIKNYFKSVPRVSDLLKSYKSVFEMKYEDIVLKPEETVYLLYKWIGSEVDPLFIEKVISKKDKWLYRGRIMPGLRYFERIENRVAKNIVLSSSQIDRINQLCKKYKIYC